VTFDDRATQQLTICLMKDLRAYYQRMPHGRAHCYEALTALAFTTATVLAAFDNPKEGQQWFNLALDQALANIAADEAYGHPRH
jgi:hypothetical protein